MTTPSVSTRYFTLDQEDLAFLLFKSIDPHFLGSVYSTQVQYGKSGTNSTSFIQSNIEEEKDFSRPLQENLQWLKLAQKSFDFWDNEDDAYYDNL